MAFFRSLQNSAFTEWLLGSDSIWTYPTVLTLHTAGMAILVGASFVIHLRVQQVAEAIPLRRLLPLYQFLQRLQARQVRLNRPVAGRTQQRIQYRHQVERRAAYDFEDIRSGCLLLQGFR